MQIFSVYRVSSLFKLLSFFVNKNNMFVRQAFSSFNQFYFLKIFFVYQKFHFFFAAGSKNFLIEEQILQLSDLMKKIVKNKAKLNYRNNLLSCIFHQSNEHARLFIINHYFNFLDFHFSQIINKQHQILKMPLIYTNLIYLSTY